MDVKDYASLTPARIEKLLREDADARKAVNEQDIKVIRHIVYLQYATTFAVLVVCALLIGCGIYFASRPEPLSVNPRPPGAVSSNGPDSSGILVDLDPLKVEWDTAGQVETIAIFIENADGGGRTVKKNVLSDVRSVVFSPDELRGVLANRNYHGHNRVRTVVEWSGHAKRSSPVDLFVGIQVKLMIGGTLIGKGKSRTIHTLLAVIDDSTATMPKNYCFNVDFAGWNNSGPLVAPLRSCNADSEVKLSFVDDINWSRRPGLVFNQPIEDRKFVRACLNAPEIRDDKC